MYATAIAALQESSTKSHYRVHAERAKFAFVRQCPPLVRIAPEHPISTLGRARKAMRIVELAEVRPIHQFGGAFNLTPLTKQALLTGFMDAVVHQDMSLAARVAIESIIQTITKQPVAFPVIPIEIIMRENVR